MSPRTSSRRQAGFTLIELLVVIAIIGILVALTTAAVQKVRDGGKRAIVVSEIGQLTMSLEQLKSRMNLREVVCRGSAADGKFILRSNYGVPGGTIDFTNSFEHKFLKQLFPSAELGGAAGFNNGLPNGPSGNGEPLDQSQLLYFWLGGYYSQGGVPTYGKGFNADARYPFYSAAEPNAKKGPFYDFPESRLNVPAGSTCPQYLDPWGSPYVFFSTENGDNKYPLITYAWNNGKVISYAAPLLVKVVSPSNVQFANQKTFQIFSAGKDRTFPFLTVPTQVNQLLWIPGTAPFEEEKPGGGDDFSNFNPTIMSVQP